MKFTRYVQIFLLFNILFNLIAITTSNKNKRTKTKTNSIANIFTTLEAEIKKAPGNLLQFVLGVFGEFLPVSLGLDQYSVLINGSKANNWSKDCLGNFAAGTEVKNTQFAKMETELNSATNKKEYCEKTKDTIKAWYTHSHSEDSKNDGGLLKYTEFAQPMVFGIRGKFTSTEKFCEQITTNKAPKTHAQIIKQYNSLAEFKKQCLYFDKISCSSFSPEASGIQAFAQNCTKYYKAVTSAAECLKTKADKSSLLMTKVLTPANLLGTLIKTAASTIVNILTFGAWGGLNGGYHLIQFALKIKDYLNNATTIPAYKIGGIVGRAMKIILSVSGIPTVRRLKKMRKN